LSEIGECREFFSLEALKVTCRQNGDDSTTVIECTVFANDNNDNNNNDDDDNGKKKACQKATKELFVKSNRMSYAITRP
jgi:hypothetical protein